MNRAQKREEKFAPLRSLTPREMVIEDMRVLEGGELVTRASLLVRSLKLKWFTPEWTREDRYKVASLPTGDQFVVRAAVPGNHVTRWEVIHNGTRQAWITGLIWEACLWLEQNRIP